MLGQLVVALHLGWKIDDFGHCFPVARDYHRVIVDIDSEQVDERIDFLAVDFGLVEVQIVEAMH